MTKIKEVVSAIGVVSIFVVVLLILIFQHFLVTPRAFNPFDDNPGVNLGRYNTYPPD